MTFNPNFYNNFRGNNFTFQNNFMPPNFLPPPPPPPPPPPRFFMPPAYIPELSDHEYVKNLEAKMLTPVKKMKPKVISITQIRDVLRNTVVTVNEIKKKEKLLSENIDILSELEWSKAMEEIQKKKDLINNCMAQMNDATLDMVRKLIAKRSAKRSRLKRLCIENKREKEQRIKEREERSRKIDENLQKIKDDINRAKQEEEAKLQADIVLKEVLRKKHNAKKCIIKLDAVMRLRKARQNTAKGRGESVCESDAVAFNKNIEKLKSLWTQKLAIYEKEESDLRAKLKEDEEQKETANETEKRIKCNLENWRQVLFGGSVATPQVDYHGDVERFVVIRSQWDQYINSEGSPLPVGWVLPVDKT